MERITLPALRRRPREKTLDFAMPRFLELEMLLELVADLLAKLPGERSELAVRRALVIDELQISGCCH